MQKFGKELISAFPPMCKIPIRKRDSKDFNLFLNFMEKSSLRKSKMLTLTRIKS